MKHIFKMKTGFIIQRTCAKCGYGKNNSRHLYPSIPLMIHWLLGETSW